MPTNIDPLTLTTVPLEQYFQNAEHETRLGQGTGFIWRAGRTRDYLVTNWHVLSGRDFFTGENLDKEHGGRPNVLRALFDIKMGFFARHPLEFPIKDEEHRPLWLIHPNRTVDIAVLPIEVVSRPANNPNVSIHLPLYPVNEVADAPIPIRVGMDVFILGYPFAIELPGYPVWKRGSIASEPELAGLISALGSAVKQTDYMLVDTASRPGMSGSPVFRRSWGNHELEASYPAVTGVPIDRFIGVYSGRAHTDKPHEAQIGLVWNASLIEEIIVGNRRDTE
jgi:Trypsin-like peptidase domain